MFQGSRLISFRLFKHSCYICHEIDCPKQCWCAVRHAASIGCLLLQDLKLECRLTYGHASKTSSDSSPLFFFPNHAKVASTRFSCVRRGTISVNCQMSRATTSLRSVLQRQQ
eukprot:308466-Chlamydomonas_euryale.AAC.3